MDRDAGLRAWNSICGASTRAQHVEISQDITSVDSIPDDFRYGFLSTDTDGNALCMGDSLEDGLGHENCKGSWTRSCDFSADRFIAEGSELVRTCLLLGEVRGFWWLEG